MHIKAGTDIVHKPRFLASLKQGKELMLARLFLPQELRQNSRDQLASIFCLKEAVIKAFELSADAWLTIATNRQPNGKVTVSLLDDRLAREITSLDSSLSHDGSWIVAVVVVLTGK